MDRHERSRPQAWSSRGRWVRRLRGIPLARRAEASGSLSRLLRKLRHTAKLGGRGNPPGAFTQLDRLRRAYTLRQS